jgi:secondary thiamine-phosphate synthase enzyme
MLKKIKLQTPPGESMTNITAEVRQAIAEAKVAEGAAFIVSPHTTAAISINSAMDPRTVEDIVDDIHRIVPTRVDFKHIYDTPADASGHIKTTLIGNSQTVIVTDGQLLLGSSQGIFFFEFDGPRSREVLVRIIADN